MSAPIAAPVNPATFKCSNKNFPQFLFEYHLQSKKVYRIDLPGVWENGVFHPDVTKGTVTAKYIGIDCETPAHFKSIVGAFFQGYQTGFEDLKAKDHLHVR